MEDREPSVASSTDFYESDAKPATPAPDVHDGSLPAKRKADHLDAARDKRQRLESASVPSTPPELYPCAGLPPAVWQHIFLSCPLPALGRLLQVNRSFHSYLSHVRAVSPSKPDSGLLRLLKSESIWASARNAHPTKPPKPLPGFTELQMWQLVWSTTCQFCDRPNVFAPGEKIWQKGPSPTGVRTIWPFAIRTCGSCLLQRCQTDASLLFSNASALRTALPFTFITNDQNYIPAYTLQAATTPAVGVDIGKYYYKPHVEAITKELDQALARGSAAAEEWYKGLDVRGKERMKTAENWERWEVKYQWWSDHQQPRKVASAAPSPASTAPLHPDKSPNQQVVSPVIHAPIPATLAPQHAQPRPPTIPPPVYTPQPVPGGAQPVRGERNLHDANEAKATRKADIERRCQLLNPPIPPNVLRHMDSFKAAIQISQPMNDYAWSVLLPRLMAHLPAAQQAEADHVSRVASVSSRVIDRRQQDVSQKEVKEVLDREWEESQRPVRDRLSALADDFINQDWDHGNAVTSENSPKFAVDLLVYVRRMFYSQAASGEDASPDPAGATESRRPKLVLENMKWVYDNKLKPLTEQFRKELFLCHGGGCEGNTKFYGFEGVIQHFGAKHTNTFSVGNVVVAWRDAEWPEETPFHPDPISVKHGYHSSGHGPSGYASYQGGFSRAGTSTPHMPAHLGQASPGPYYGGHYNGPYAPPNAQLGTSGYDNAQSYGAPVEAYPGYQPMRPPGYGSYNGYTTSPAMSNVAIVPPPLPPQGQSSNDQGGPPESDHRTNLMDKQVSTIIDLSQDLWKQTSGIKDLPNSLRVYILLQRVISKFQIEFNHEPKLHHFIEAFSSHQIPKALKNAPGLSCKACQDEVAHSASASHVSQREERRTYTVLNLFSHFKAQHGGPQARDFGNGHPPTHLDWRENMIELPNDRFISGLIHAPGMDDEKLHIIATVFPRLFPTPLPRIGAVNNDTASSADQPGLKDTEDAPGIARTGGISTETSGPSSYTDSPRPPKPTEDEYDPQRPALLAQTSRSATAANRRNSYHGSPPADHRARYYAEPRYYVSREPLDNDYPGPREYIEYAPSPRRIRAPIPVYEDYPGRRAIYREDDHFYAHGSEVFYAHPPPDDGFRPHPIRYVEADDIKPEYRPARPPSRDPSPGGRFAEADRFLGEITIGQPSAPQPAEQDHGLRTEPPSIGEPNLDDGSRYTSPRPTIPAGDNPVDNPRGLAGTHPAAPSTISTGSRYEEYPTGRRQVPTPESAGAQRKPPSRRREKDHVPSRYYRYMSVARDEPYARGASVGRSQNRRYERYEEQRRRIDQQETSQPSVDRDHHPYPRDQNADHGPLEESYYPPVRSGPREYIPIQGRLYPQSPTRVRYAGPTDDGRGPPPVYVEEFDQPLHEYEIIRVPRDYRPAYTSRPSYPPSRYLPEHDSEHIQYVPVSYDRPPPQRLDGRSGEYVYYEERERPLPARRPAFEPDNEAPYEPPPEIKIEGVAPVANGS